MSIGIVAYRYGPRGREYLLIRRKDTLGYVDFMRGKYSLNDRDHMQSLIDEMSMEEKERLLKYDFDHLWCELWGGKIGVKYRNEENVSRDKSNTLKDGVPTHDFPCDLEQLINASTTSWTEPEWGFPKGRRNYLEKDIDCAVREFEEETGYSRHDVEILYNVSPFEEIFTGSNYKSYKHRYYIAQHIGLPDVVPQHQMSEVGKLEWKTYQECLKTIRDYNVEKLDVLHRVETLLNEYRVYK
jgi:ADP-ribose pyrophosphatase YjhB (NUDIX family)